MAHKLCASDGPQYLGLRSVNAIFSIAASAYPSSASSHFGYKPNANRAAFATAWASTPKNWRSAARVSLRPKPSVPRVM